MELHRRHQKEENLQMLDLNQRLESYLGHVRQLEVENELLRREIQGLKGCGQGGWMGLQDKLSLARQEVEEVWREKDQVEMELRSLAEELHDLGLLRQQVAGAHGEVNKKLAESKKQMEEEGRAQIWLRRKVSQLEEEIQFQVQTQQKEVANLQDTLIHVTPALAIPPTRMGTQLPNLHELGQEYSQMAVRAWQEATMCYQGQVDRLEESLSQAKSRLVQVGQEKTESLLKLQSLENELASAQDRKMYLESHLSHQRDSQREDIQDLQAHVEVLEMEKVALGDQIASLLTESRGLLQLKMTLGMEVATYRALLDNEGLTGNFTVTKQQRSTYITDGVHNPRGVKRGFQTQLDTVHRINGTSILQGQSRQPNATMTSSSPIWTPNCKTLNQIPQSSRKTEEEQVNFSLESKHQPRWSTPYTKVPKDGIAVDHFRPQDVHEEVNHAEPLSPPNEEAGADLVARHGSPDFDAPSMWDMEKEETDKNIVRNWLAEEEPFMESPESHQVTSCFYVPPLLNDDAETICSSTVSHERAQSISLVSDAHSHLKTHDDINGILETPSETKEHLNDSPSSPVNAWEERAPEILYKDVEDVEEQCLESEMAFETKTSSNMFEHGVRKTVYSDSEEENISYESSQPSQYAEEALNQVRKLEEDVINLSKKDENDIQYEKQVKDDLQNGIGNEDKFNIAEGFNDMKEIAHLSEEVFHHVDSVEEGDINLSIEDKRTNVFNQCDEKNHLSTYGIETDEGDRVGCYIEKDDMREKMKDCIEESFQKEEEMFNHREPQANECEQMIASDGENLNENEQVKIHSTGENLDISEQEQIPSGEENLDKSVQEQIHSSEVYLEKFEQEKTQSVGEEFEDLDLSEKEQVPSLGENQDLSEQEQIHLIEEKFDTPEQEKICTDEENMEKFEQDNISLVGKTLDLDLSEKEQIHSVAEKLDTSEQEKMVSGGENMDISEQEQIPSDEENLYKPEQVTIPSVEEKLDISEKEQISSFGFNLDLSEQEQIHSIGEQLDISEPEQIPSIAEKLDTSDQQKCVSGGDNLDISEQEQIHAIEEKLNLSEQENILSDDKNLDISEQEQIPSSEENLDKSGQEKIPSVQENLDISEQETISLIQENMDIPDQEQIPVWGENLDIAEQEQIPSDGEKIDISKNNCISSSGQTLNLPDNDDEVHDVDENDSPTTSISWKAELVGGSYAQENTLADTRPLIRYKSDETDANTQASHMGESDSSDGEEDKDVRKTGTCTWGEGKSKPFGTMEDLNEVSEGNAMDHEGNEDTVVSEAKENGKQGSNDKHDEDLWKQKAGEELLYEEPTTPKDHSEEDYEKIDRLVEQELENLSISSYSEHFIGQMSESESVVSFQAKDIEEEHGCLPSSSVKNNLSESDKLPIGEEKLNQSHEEHFLSSEEKPNQSEPDEMPLREEKLNQSQQEHIASSEEQLNQSEPGEMTLDEEKLNQSQQKGMSSETMSSVHSTIVMTSEHTYFREESAKMSQAAYMAQENVFSNGLQADKGENNDQNISMLNNANQTNDHSIHCQNNRMPEIQTNINNSDIEESNSSDDDSPNASQYLNVTTTNVTTGQEDLDAAVSQMMHSSVDCITLVEHSAGEVTNYQTSNECLQEENLDILGQPTKYPESGDTFTSHIKDMQRSLKPDSRDQDIQKFFSSGVDNEFWSSDLEKGATYQPLEPFDHVTKQSNQSLALANNLVWGDLDNPQMSNYKNMDSGKTKDSALEEDEKRSPSQMTNLMSRDLVEGVNVASEDEGDSWSSGDE